MKYTLRVRCAACDQNEQLNNVKCYGESGFKDITSDSLGRPFESVTAANMWARRVFEWTATQWVILDSDGVLQSD